VRRLTKEESLPPVNDFTRITSSSLQYKCNSLVQIARISILGRYERGTSPINACRCDTAFWAWGFRCEPGQFGEDRGAQGGGARVRGALNRGTILRYNRVILLQPCLHCWCSARAAQAN